MSSEVFADLFGGISGELLLLGLSPRFPLMISGVPSHSPIRHYVLLQRVSKADYSKNAAVHV